MLRLIEIGVWYASFVIEAWLIVRLLRSSRRTSPVFLAFLVYDFPRWLILVVINYLWPRTRDYAVIWAWTEPLSIVLLAAAGIEAWSRLTVRTLPVWMYIAMIAPLLSIGWMLPAIDHVPLERFFLIRSLATFTVAALLIMTMIWTDRIWHHPVILTCFCMFDLMGNLGIVFGSPRYHPETFQVITQTACLIGWLTFSYKQQRRCINGYLDGIRPI